MDITNCNTGIENSACLYFFKSKLTFQQVSLEIKRNREIYFGTYLRFLCICNFLNNFNFKLCIRTLVL